VNPVKNAKGNLIPRCSSGGSNCSFSSTSTFPHKPHAGVQHVVFVEVARLQPIASSMRRPSEATNRTIVEYGSFSRSAMASACSGFNSARTTLLPRRS